MAACGVQQTEIIILHPVVVRGREVSCEAHLFEDFHCEYLVCVFPRTLSDLEHLKRERARERERERVTDCGFMRYKPFGTHKGSPELCSKCIIPQFSHKSPTLLNKFLEKSQ